MTHPPHDGPQHEPPAGETETQEPNHNGSSENGSSEIDATPYGAIAVTLFLAATILVFWFGMYALNLSRS